MSTAYSFPRGQLLVNTITAPVGVKGFALL